MKILGIDGSPRENGNTEKLVKAILQGAEANGAETRHYKVAGMNISPCLGCMDCRESGICIHEDDMTPLYDEIQSSDAMHHGGRSCRACTNHLKYPSDICQQGENITHLKNL